MPPDLKMDDIELSVLAEHIAKLEANLEDVDETLAEMGDTFTERLKSLEAFANKASDDLTFVMTSMIDISHALADVINRLDELEEDRELDKNGQN
jgi:uncharacterized protein YydD (DUF2326 family)